MTEQPDLRQQYADKIRPVMLVGLQDAELYDEPGTERINEWVDWIAETLAAVHAAEPEAPHDSRRRWRVETYDPIAKEWAPGSALLNRDGAWVRLEQAERVAPLWRDDKTPVQRRIVRETTTYAVETER